MSDLTCQDCFAFESGFCLKSGTLGVTPEEIDPQSTICEEFDDTLSVLHHIVE